MRYCVQIGRWTSKQSHSYHDAKKVQRELQGCFVKPVKVRKER